jgi:hypothetical protein
MFDIDLLAFASLMTNMDKPINQSLQDQFDIRCVGQCRVQLIDITTIVPTQL